MLEDLKVCVEYMIRYYYFYFNDFFWWEECRDLLDPRVDISLEEFNKIRVDKLSEIIDGLSELHDEIYVELGMGKGEAKKFREVFQEFGQDYRTMLRFFIDDVVDSLVRQTKIVYIYAIITLCYCYHYYKGKNKEKIVSALEKFLKNLIGMTENEDWFQGRAELAMLNKKIVEKVKQALREAPIWEIKDPEIVHYFKNILKDKDIFKGISKFNYKEIFPNLPWWWEKYNKIHLSLDKIWKMEKIRKIATFIQKMEVFILIFLFACFLILQQLKFLIMFILFLLFMEYLKKNI